MEQNEARQGPRTWVVVTLTLGAVFVALVLFLAGVVTGVAISDDVEVASGTTGTSPVQPDPGAPGGSAADGTLDDCVVGTWRTTEHSESADTEQGRVTITGVDRTLEITADGTETVTYAQTPAQVSTDQGQGRAVYDGTVVYGVSTSGETMSFSLRSVEGTITVTTADGREQTEDLKPGSADVTYTCSDDELVQEATGYRSVMRRVL